MVVRAPEIAKKIKPGQFIMLRIDEQGERIPLTMNDWRPGGGHDYDHLPGGWAPPRCASPR